MQWNFAKWMTATDAIVVALAFASLPVLFVTFWGDSGPGTRVEIVTPDKHKMHFSLRDTRDIRLAGPLGETHLIIAKGRARFVSSPCSQKQCVHSGWLSRNGDFAACLPNHISLFITSDKEAFDAINF